MCEPLRSGVPLKHYPEAAEMHGRVLAVSRQNWAVRARTAILAVLLINFSIPGASAAGDVEAGRDLVTRSCTPCHTGENTPKGTDAAPTLAFLARINANEPGWVHKWLLDPHPRMRGIHLSRRQIDDVVAYLNSLPVK